MDYAVLYYPGHNRVYFETSLKLAVSEFCAAAQSLETECRDVKHQTIQGIDYLTFSSEHCLSDKDIRTVSGLSFVYAVFQLQELQGELFLKPVLRLCENFVDDSISTILKYSGKTNEIFTRMLINLGCFSQAGPEQVRILDPIAGKGTTLFEGLIKGYHVYGIEIGDKVTAEAYHFLQRFLENARYKFEFKTTRISGANKSFSAVRHTFEIARSKQEAKAGIVRTAEFVNGNAQYADKYFKKNFFDAVIGDLPYGIQHGNVTTEKQSSLTRNPAELLHACLPAWREVLKKNGCIVLAWNSNVLSRSLMEELLVSHGFILKQEACYQEFEHRVDQSIKRDIVVAVK